MGSNEVFLLGRLGQDPSMHKTKSGSNMCKLRVATSEVRKGQDGTKIENTQWHDVLVFGNNANTCATYLHKGREVYIRGRIEYKQKEYKEVTYKEASIIAEEVTFIGKSNKTNEVKTPFSNTGERVVSSVGNYPTNTSHEVLVEEALQDEEL